MEGCRVAEPADLDVIAELVGLGVAEQAEARGGPIWSRRETQPPPYRMSVEAAFHDPDREVWVGTIDETVVGYGICGVEVLRTGELMGVISDLFVLEGAREVAVGERMIGVILEWCEARECVGVDALALPGNRQTKNFFETFGFKARLLTVHRPLRGFEER